MFTILVLLVNKLIFIKGFKKDESNSFWEPIYHNIFLLYIPLYIFFNNLFKRFFLSPFAYNEIWTLFNYTIPLQYSIHFNKNFHKCQQFKYYNQKEIQSYFISTNYINSFLIWVLSSLFDLSLLLWGSIKTSHFNTIFPIL